MKILFAMLAAACLSGCLPAANAHYVTELKCGSASLDENHKCSNIQKVGSDFEILVNATTQKVQITITKNAGDWYVTSMILENCSVVDLNNWMCKDETRSKPGAPFQIEIINTYAMHRGHFYRSLTGGAPPHYYSSGVSGWRRLAMQNGFLTPEQAQAYE